MDNNKQDLIHLRPESPNEVDLGELILKLIGEWKLITAVTALGAFASLVIALQQTSIYRVEAIIAAPNIAELSVMVDQPLVSISSEKAIERVAENLFSVKNQKIVFGQSELFQISSQGNSSNLGTLFANSMKDLTISRVEREFYTLAENQRAPFKEVSIVLDSAYAGQAALFVNALTTRALALALETFREDTTARKLDQITKLEIEMIALRGAGTTARLGNIKRLEEQNNLARDQLLLELALLEQQAKTNRLKRIAQLDEAIPTAAGLKITEPVTWEDLRPASSNAQILNDLSTATRGQPLYFQGTRLLTAEREMLRARTNDLLHVQESAELQFQLDQLAADPKIAALKQREDDTIYIANYDALQTQLSVLENLDTDFPSARMATIIQPAIRPTEPIKPNRKLIAVAGTVLAGFLAMFFALIRIMVKK
jgi:LPS O-antigen subunit length determinant protein (WzzB/FepE family)